ncbi:MAG: hypothetical protein HOL15_07135 [Nitrospinaceae bacterium]|nr:hypothetical protein [Nitrospinaceae bacterium]
MLNKADVNIAGYEYLGRIHSSCGESKPIIIQGVSFAQMDKDGLTSYKRKKVP